MNKNDWLVPEWPAPANVKAISTLRTGGVSAPPYDSLNFGAYVNDNPDAVAQNKQWLHEAAQLPAEPYWLKQVHGTDVIDLSSLAVPSHIIDMMPIADATISFKPDQVCVVTTADCLPILICDDKGTRVAAIHAGWRGLAAGVIEASVKRLNCESSRLMAWLGPAIGPASFEVGEDVRKMFKNKGDHEAFLPSAITQNNSSENSSLNEIKWKLDIYRVATQRLHHLGISRVFGGGFCTFLDENRFFSHRRATVHGEQTGRMATLIWLT